jgi:hypothetical protein
MLAKSTGSRVELSITVPLSSIGSWALAVEKNKLKKIKKENRCIDVNIRNPERI